MAEALEQGLEQLQLGGLNHAHIGARHNDWVGPITVFGKCDKAWEESLKSSPYVGDIDFGRREWARSRDAVNAVMKKLLEEIRKEATKHEGLRIDSYIRQGSSRDGLKVIAANEFDSVFEFHIEGLKIEKEDVKKSGAVIPGFCFFKVLQSMQVLEKKFPKLCKAKVFQQVGETIFLSPKHLHERVLTSLIDTAVNAVEASLKSEKVDFSITRKKNPPAINITIHLNADAHQAIMKEGKLKNQSDAVEEIDLDIVPALLLRKDTSTKYEDLSLNCPVHAVCKWAEGDTVKKLSFVKDEEKNLIWHVNTAGYEKHALDVARNGNDLKRHYVLTALRIMKTFFERAKTMAKEKKESPPQLVSVLRSYHLKHIAFYLLMYTCHIYKKVKIDGAQQAVIYFVCLLEAALEVEHLPHFFYSNSKIAHMFPGFPAQERLKYDHFAKAAPGSLMQALRSLQKLLIKELKIDTKAIEPKMVEIVQVFKAEISAGEYF